MLKQSRLEALTDGVFAIVMTLLVIEIRVPEIMVKPDNAELATYLIHIFPLIISYALSFTVLFVYWRAHHYITSIFAKTSDDNLASLNALFLLFVGLTPFSTHFLGSFGYSEVAIALYGVNMILISLSLLAMRLYIRQSNNIIKENMPLDSEIRGMMRIVTPLVLFIIALLVSFFNPRISISLFLIAIFFNLFPGNARFMYKEYKSLVEFLNKHEHKKRAMLLHKQELEKQTHPDNEYHEPQN